MRSSIKGLGHFRVEGWPYFGLNAVNPMTWVHKRKGENKAEPPTRYFLKNTNDALPEVIASEFLRLIIPGQPKTRCIRPEVGGDLQVISKDAGSFCAFSDLDPDVLEANLCNGTYKGLGMVCVGALVVNETDMHSENVGINANHQVVKIDGGWSFHACKDTGKNNILVARQCITHKVIQELPFARDYKAINWLDNVRRQTKQAGSYSAALQGNKAFRREVHVAILRCMLLPDQLIDEFVNRYTEDRVDIARVLADELKKRIRQLWVSMSNDQSFYSFLLSESAEKEVEEYGSYLETFHTTSKEVLLQNAKVSKADVVDRLKILRNKHYPGIYQGTKYFSCLLFTIGDFIAAMPNLRAKNWREYEDGEMHSVLFMQRFHEFLVEYPLTEEEADKLVNAAYENEIVCFDLLYNAIVEKLGTTFYISLGFYKQYMVLLNNLINASDFHKADEAANHLEVYLMKYENMFKQNGKIFLGYDLVDVRLFSFIGTLLGWNDRMIEQYQASIYYKNRLAWSQQSLSIAKISVRLNSRSDDVVVKHIPLAFISYLMSNGRRFSSDAKESTSSCFIKIIKKKYAINKQKIINLDAAITRPAVEKYISDNKEFLAFFDLLPDIENRLFSYCFLPLLKYHPEVGVAFIRDFYCNTMYDHGLYALRAVRERLMPQSMREDGWRAFHNTVRVEEDIYSKPILALLIYRTPEIISMNDMLVVLDFHFSVKRLPLWFIQGTLKLDISTPTLVHKALSRFFDSDTTLPLAIRKSLLGDIGLFSAKPGACQKTNDQLECDGFDPKGQRPS